MIDDCYCDYDPPQFFSCRTVKAQKSHKCYECGRVICSGESYEYAAGRWDYFTVFKTCSHCMDMRTFVKNSVPCFCWAYGSLRDDIRDTVEHAYYRAKQEVAGLYFRLGRMEVERKRFAEKAA